ncbi:isochorismatase family protein [Chitinophaga agrisoli]|uniref:Isochorismatase family protein n=1 Tax=Chitinophaga agrisoli TaxID=2607653 RepID=A0A5B2VV00_9BACT|nr:isochorismatase family protein [Chitinophaga agrisoli]KAA2241919.1 isochorismatase family protein [Chitinophaga agrisoli]
MAITALDKQTALVIIDLQKGIVGMETVPPAATVVANAIALIQAFRKENLPVVAVNVSFAPDFSDAIRTRNEKGGFAPPAGWDELIPELDLQPSDIRITKRNWSAFYGTALDLHLRRRGITNIVLCGIATSIGVEGTARSAHERAYNVTFASDAMSDSLQSAQEHSLKVIFPRIGEVGTTEEIIRLLQAR